MVVLFCEAPCTHDPGGGGGGRGGRLGWGGVPRCTQDGASQVGDEGTFAHKKRRLCLPTFNQRGLSAGVFVGVSCPCASCIGDGSAQALGLLEGLQDRGYTDAWRGATDMPFLLCLQSFHCRKAEMPIRLWAETRHTATRPLPRSRTSSYVLSTRPEAHLQL